MSDTPYQPIPKISDDDVERIIRRDFPLAVQEQVRAALARYGREPWEREPARVRMGILRLAHGDAAAVERHLRVAKTDFRDVLSAAEYPGASIEWGKLAALTPDERAKLHAADWEQYRAWLARPAAGS